MSLRTHRLSRIIVLYGVVFACAAHAADSIEGVQPAALDQPRIFMCLRRDAQGKILETKDKDARSGIEAFLDTGASGVVLSSDTCGQLGVAQEKTRDGKPIDY